MVFFHQFDFETRSGYGKDTLSIIAIFTIINWVKPVQPSDLLFLISTLMMGTLQLQYLNCECLASEQYLAGKLSKNINFLIG